MELLGLNFAGLAVGLGAFLTIGVFHPIVIKCEYHFGVKCWWWFLVAGLIFAGLSLAVEDTVLSTLIGVVAFSCLWSILEIFEQRERVRKGWFPAKPGKKD